MHCSHASLMSSSSSRSTGSTEVYPGTSQGRPSTGRCRRRKIPRNNQVSAYLGRTGVLQEYSEYRGLLSRSTADIDRGNTGANLVLMALHSEPHRGLALWPAGEVKSSPRRGGSERGCVLERSPARPRRGWFGRSREKAQPGHCHLGARPIRGARPLPGLAARRKA